jgi:hypothetical protein
MGADSLRHEIEKHLRSQGLNHEQRRVAMRHLFREDGPRLAYRQLVERSSLLGDLEELLSKYPMRPADARTIWRYVAGLASREAADSAFLASLRDPRWMMRWFDANHSTLSPVVTWLRAPAHEFAENLTTSLQPLRAIAHEMRLHAASNILVPHLERRLTDLWAALPLQFINAALKAVLPDAPPLARTELRDSACPGLQVTAEAILGTVRDAVSRQPRPIADSDFGDVMHATYAPYVDVFRADGYMAQHIRRGLGNRKTVVVGDLRELPTVLGATTPIA